MNKREYFLYCINKTTLHQGLERHPVSGFYPSAEAAKAAWEAAGRPGMSGQSVFISVEEIQPNGLSLTVDEIVLKHA